MKIFVTGVGGQLGHDVVNEAIKRGHEAIGSDIAAFYSGIQDGSAVTTAPYVSLDITDRDSVMNTAGEARPDAIIHCAAWTNVDAAEEESNRPLVYKINVEGTRHIAEAAKAVDAKLLYLSTDYVFNGEGTRPWQPDDKNFKPLNYYGETKLGGELAVTELVKKYFIVRIAWVFGLNGKNFIKTMVNIGRNHDTVRVVNDQIGTPTYTFDLARLLVDMIETEKYGFYHATNSEVSPLTASNTSAVETCCKPGFISWYDLTCEIYKQAKIQATVIPVSTAEYTGAGSRGPKRPANSRLDKSKLIEARFEPLPVWTDAVKRYLKEAGL